ncbi:MAG: selenocysteine-specific translation elongation factor [Acidobacteria bacterium]|nr:selenocysteine-specific translation elongation factor [Acidobacteriota bacterium]
MEKVVGTAGHIDHGKTALVKALTGVDADRLPEEKRRGITIDLGFAETTIGDIHFGFVDVPGHERFVKNMLAGASGIDVVLLVVAATEGVMPQTREHFDISRLLGITSGVVALTKADLADEETIAMARLDVAELVAGSFLEKSPLIAVSSVTGSGIDDLRLALAEAAGAGKRKDNTLAMRLPIDRSFTMKGFGTVVTGTLASGTVTEGDELELLPQKRKVRVRGLQSHGRSLHKVSSGGRVALNLTGVDHSEIERGMTLGAPSVFHYTQAVDAHIEVLPNAARPLRTRQRVRFHIGTNEVLARLQVLNEKAEIPPGGRGFAQVRLESPVVAVAGDRFILRSYSPQVTIAGGVVLDPFAMRYRRREQPTAVARLSNLKDSLGDERELTRAFIQTSGETGITTEELSARLGMSGSVVGDLVAEGVKAGQITDTGVRYVAAAIFPDLRQRTFEAVNEFQKKEPLAKGIPRDVLREKAGARLTEDIFLAIISAEERSGRLTSTQGLIQIAGRSQQLGQKETEFVDMLTRTYSAAGLAVPKASEVISGAVDKTGVSSTDGQKLLRTLLDSGELVKVSDEFIFARAVIDELVARLRSHASSSGDRAIDVAVFKDLAGVSRKYAIPLLEYFDREKVTVRAGEKRVIL